jgi:simple sugar transport system ATP-binding protein
MEPIIELKDIEKSFGKVTALQGISLKMHPAEVHCLLGDNGAGIGVIFITHNVHHAWAVGDAFIDLVPPDYWNAVLDHGLSISAVAGHQPLEIGLNRVDLHDRELS